MVDPWIERVWSHVSWVPTSLSPFIQLGTDEYLNSLRLTLLINCSSKIAILNWVDKHIVFVCMAKLKHWMVKQNAVILQNIIRVQLNNRCFNNCSNNGFQRIIESSISKTSKQQKLKNARPLYVCVLKHVALWMCFSVLRFKFASQLSVSLSLSLSLSTSSPSLLLPSVSHGPGYKA